MSEPPDFGRLTQNWLYWSELGQLTNLSVSTSCDDCAVRFSSNDYSVHLRDDGDWWVVDTVNDRRQRNNDTARFSRYELAEKYLVWTWASMARSVVRAPLLGPTLYSRGFASDIEAVPISEGVYKLQSADERAILTEPAATIFSHLMHVTEDEIERMVRADLGG